MEFIAAGLIGIIGSELVYLDKKKRCGSKPLRILQTTFKIREYLYLMHSNFSAFYRRSPDNITEELVTALSNSKSYEFKALFSVIHAALRGPWQD